MAVQWASVRSTSSKTDDWRVFKVLLLYSVTIIAGCYWLKSELEGVYFQDRGIGLADVITAPLGVWWGWLLPVPAAAYAVRPGWVAATISLLAIGAWFMVCVVAMGLA